MTKIYLSNQNSGAFKSAVTPTIKLNGTTEEQRATEINPLNVWWNVNAEYFEIKVTYQKEHTTIDTETGTETLTYTSTPYYWHKLPVSELVKKSSWGDQTLWQVKYADSREHPFVINEDGSFGPVILNATEITDKFSDSYNSKNLKVNLKENDVLYEVFVPFTSNDMTNFTYRVFLDTYGYAIDNAQIPYVISETASPSPEEITLPVEAGFVSTLISPITLTGPTQLTAGSTATVTVNTTPGISYVYLEQVNGILPKLKIPLTNGVGTFNIVTMGIDAGDEIQVKVGFKKWTNATTYKLRLS